MKRDHVGGSASWRGGLRFSCWLKRSRTCWGYFGGVEGGWVRVGTGMVEIEVLLMQRVGGLRV
jgi:hypothetical protein